MELREDALGYEVQTNTKTKTTEQQNKQRKALQGQLEMKIYIACRRHISILKTGRLRSPKHLQCWWRGGLVIDRTVKLHVSCTIRSVQLGFRGMPCRLDQRIEGGETGQWLLMCRKHHVWSQPLFLWFCSPADDLGANTREPKSQSLEDILRWEGKIITILHFF